MRSHSQLIPLLAAALLVSCRESSVEPKLDGTSRQADVTQATWTTLAPMPYARGAINTAVVGNRLFVVGGGGDGGYPVVLAYDAIANAWTRKADLPYPQNAPAAASINGIVYVAGGCGFFSDCRIETHNRLHAYDVASNTWSTLPSMPTARHSSAGVAVNGKFWVLGGRTGSVGSSSAVEAYDPVANAWTTYTAMPRPRVSLAAVSLNGLIYVMGGDNNSRPQDTFETFDPVTQTWTLLPPMPRLVAGIGAAVAEGRIYVFADYDVNPVTFAYVATNRVMIYDPATATWSDGPPIPTRRYAPVPQTIGNTILVTGNDEAGQVSTVLEGLTVSVEPATGTIVLPIPTFGNVAVSDLMRTDGLLMYVLRASNDSVVFGGYVGSGGTFNVQTFSDLPEGSYRVELRDWSQHVIVASTRMLVRGQTLQMPLDLKTVAAMVTGSLKVNGEVAPNGTYDICTVTYRCNAVRNGNFQSVVPAGAGAFEIRTAGGATLGRFTYNAAIGETVTSFTNASGQTISIAEVEDPTGTVVIPTVTYRGTPINDLMLVDGLLFYLMRVIDESTVMGDYVRYDSRTLSMLAPGDYRAELRDWDQHVILSNTRTLAARQSAEIPLDLSLVAGLLQGSLQLNGQPAGNNAYLVCVKVFRCNFVRDGAFQIPVMPGPGSFEIRTVDGAVLGTYTFVGAVGQTTKVGSITDAPASMTAVGANVMVAPANGSAGSTNTTVWLKFANVTGAGSTKVTQTSAAGAMPAGIQLGDPAVFYNLTTTASYTGPVQTCVNYTGTTFQTPDKLKLLHGNADGTWADVTTSIDRTNRIICGTTTSLSPFVVVEGDLNRPPVITSSSSNFTATEGAPVTLAMTATDPDGDGLSYQWDLDNDGVVEQTTTTGSVQFTFVDNGTRTIKLTVSDGKGGADTRILTVDIGNIAPTITQFEGPAAPLALTNGVATANLTATFTDPGSEDTFTADALCEGGTSAGASATAVSATGSCRFTHAGVFSVTLRVTDDDNGVATATPAYVVVYDPSAGFITGGGWINSPAGAYTADPSLTGKATFGFVSKYLKGATTPTGNTEFKFHAANMTFVSSTYEWLVVSGPMAQFKGTGTVNGVGGYAFLLTATDGQVNGGGGVDRFRIRITGPGGVVYDNVPGGGNGLSDANPQMLGGGSIMISNK